MKRKLEYGEGSRKEYSSRKVGRLVEKSAAEENVKSKVKTETAEEKVKNETAEENVKSKVKNETAEEKVKIEAAEEREMCRIWTLPMVIFLIKKLNDVRTCKTRTLNVQFQHSDWEDIATAINKKKFKCTQTGECQECGTYVVLYPLQVRDKYYKMKNGCQDLLEIYENTKYKKDRKRWREICKCTETKSVAGSSAKAFTAESVSSSCAIGPTTNEQYEDQSKKEKQYDDLLQNVVTAVEELGLDGQLLFKAIKLVHGMDEKMMGMFLKLNQSSRHTFVVYSDLE